MPVLQVRGIPSQASNVGKLKKDLAKAVASVTELQRLPEHVSVDTPADLTLVQTTDHLTCIVDILYDKPERTKQVRDCLVANIRAVLTQFIRDQPQLVEGHDVIIQVFTSRFNTAQESFSFERVTVIQ